MKIKNILYLFLLITIVMAPDICAMEQPNGQTEQLSRRPYPSNLPLLLYCGHHLNDESYLSKLPIELIVEIINHASKIQKDQDSLNKRNDRDLLHVVKVNSKDGVSRLLNEPYIDINVKDNVGYTPLILATMTNYPKIVQILLDKGANPNIQGRFGWTALIWAVLTNNLKIALMLLDKNANPNIQNRDGRTALIEAVINNKPKIVQMLLNANANLNIQDQRGNTALVIAFSQNNQAIIDLIINAKEKLDNVGTSKS